MLYVISLLKHNYYVNVVSLLEILEKGHVGVGVFVTLSDKSIWGSSDFLSIKTSKYPYTFPKINNNTINAWIFIIFLYIYYY